MANESNLKVTTVHEPGNWEEVWHQHSLDPDRIEVQDLNKIPHSKVTLYKEPTLKGKQGQEAIGKLVEMCYLAEYGDYMVGEYKRLYIPQEYNSTQKLGITSIH